MFAPNGTVDAHWSRVCEEGPLRRRGDFMVGAHWSRVCEEGPLRRRGDFMVGAHWSRVRRAWDFVGSCLDRFPSPCYQSVTGYLA